VGLVGDDHHRLEMAQIAVGPPVLGELDGRAHELVGVLLELFLEPFEQREGVGGRAGKAADDLVADQPANLARLVLHHRVADRNLAVAGDHHLVALAHRDDGRAVPAGKVVVLWHSTLQKDFSVDKAQWPECNDRRLAMKYSYPPGHSRAS